MFITTKQGSETKANPQLYKKIRLFYKFLPRVLLMKITLLGLIYGNLVGYFLISFAKISNLRNWPISWQGSMFPLLRHLIDLHWHNPWGIIVGGVSIFVYLLRMTPLSINVFQHFSSVSQCCVFYTMKHSSKTD